MLLQKVEGFAAYEETGHWDTGACRCGKTTPSESLLYLSGDQETGKVDRKDASWTTMNWKGPGDHYFLKAGGI